MRSEEFWQALQEAMKNKASDAMWSAGLSSLRLVDYSNGVLTISAPNQIQLLRVQQKYLPFITEEAQYVSGVPTTVSLVVAPESAAPLPEPEPLEVHEPVENTATVLPASDRPLRLKSPGPRCRHCGRGNTRSGV